VSKRTLEENSETKLSLTDDVDDVDDEGRGEVALRVSAEADEESVAMSVDDDDDDDDNVFLSPPTTSIIDDVTDDDEDDDDDDVPGLVSAGAFNFS